MKIILEVAEGVHAGKQIPLPGPEFLIGREPQCQLRPASPLISNRHCAVLVRGGRAVVRDFGSTNGTFVNGERVEGEKELAADDLLNVGPLAFYVRFVGQPAPAAPVPEARNPAAPAAGPEADVRLGEEAPGSGPDSDRLAAILLAGGDDTPDREPTESDVPQGDTVFEMPAVDATKGSKDKSADVKKAQESNASIAGDILRKFHQRPRN